MTELKLASPDRLQILLEFRAAVDCPADPALAAGTLPAGSTSVSAKPGPHAIESQPVRLGANFLRPERRSDDGQTILNVA
jgi:hypothetical protein